jgi:hypothetical protein
MFRSRHKHNFYFFDEYRARVSVVYLGVRLCVT